MSDQKRCCRCNAEMLSDAPEGLCPRCLMQQALEADPSERDSNTSAWQGGFTPPDPAALAEAFPQLEVFELIGQGGMGAVYKAKQSSLDRIVALKILPPEAGRDPTFAERFTREAKSLAMLNHPNIVSVYDSGCVEFRDESGKSAPLYYFVMEFIDGLTIREAQQRSALSPSRALDVIPQICDALQFAHEKGIVHRDIKPENVMIDESGRVKVADFGLSKLLARTPVNITLTASHQVMGTLHYMAPEQVQRPLEVDHRADIYSLGVVFYELLTGEVPIGRFPLPSEKLRADKRLDDVVLKAMQREPQRRYQQAVDIKTDVQALASDGAVDNISDQPNSEAMPATSQTMPPLDDQQFEAARRQVQGPAIGLIIVGVVNLLPIAIVLIGMLASLVVIPFKLQSGPHLSAIAQPGTFAVVAQMGTPGVIELVIILLILGIQAPAACVMIAGGWKMRTLEAYSLATTAGILALLPATTGCIVGLPIGIWALMVLFRSDVKAAFDRRPHDASAFDERKPLTSEELAAVKRQVGGPSAGLFVVAALTLLPVVIVVGAVVMRLMTMP